MNAPGPGAFVRPFVQVPALRLLGALAVMGGLISCSSTGYGTGEVVQAHTPADFEWVSHDGGRTGTLSAWVGLGLHLQGPFGEVVWQTADGLVQAGTIAELRSPPHTGFVADRSEVLADLGGTGGQTLLCSLHVANPARGLRDGADGSCLFDGTQAMRVHLAATR